MDSASVLRAALELFSARQFPGVAVVCAEALDHDPDNLHLRLLRARALIALRWLDEARVELAECARIDAASSVVYRLLGEVALRSDRPDAAMVFLNEALRLDPDDHEASEWLDIATALHRTAARSRAAPPPPFRPTAAAEQLPAAAAVVGHFPRRPAPPSLRPSTAAEQLPAAVAVEGHLPPPLRPLPFRPSATAEQHPAASAAEGHLSAPLRPLPFRPSATAEQHPAASAAEGHFASSLKLRPVAAAGKHPAAAAATGHLSGRASSPPGEPRATSSPPPLPLASGFGNYLVEIGVLSDPQLRAALAYKRATGVRLGRAVTTLGFATELKIEWASLAYHGRHQRPGQASIWESEPPPPERRA